MSQRLVSSYNFTHLQKMQGTLFQPTTLLFNKSKDAKFVTSRPSNLNPNYDAPYVTDILPQSILSHLVGRKLVISFYPSGNAIPSDSLALVVEGSIPIHIGSGAGWSDGLLIIENRLCVHSIAFKESSLYEADNSFNIKVSIFDNTTRTWFGTFFLKLKV